MHIIYVFWLLIVYIYKQKEHAYRDFAAIFTSRVHKKAEIPYGNETISTLFLTYCYW